MKTQVGETRSLEVNLARAGSVPMRQPLVARCSGCNAETFFSARQVATAHQIWKLASGRDGAAAEVDFLGGDGTTNQCGCGMEGEVVFTGEKASEAHWRSSRFATSA